MLFLRTATRAAIDLLYPERCIHCGRFGDTLCAICEASMTPATGAGRCGHCSAAWEGADNCPRCFHLSHLDGVRAAFEMEGAARHVVHALKYRGIETLAPTMASHIQPLRLSTPFDVVYAVPLHRSRRRCRGFNQAELLVGALGWPPGEGRLSRVRKTETQVGMHLGERRINVSGAFAYSGPPLRGLTVAVVDDVVTTSATANECAAVLKEHGAQGVVAFAFTRASYNPAAPAAAIED